MSGAGDTSGREEAHAKRTDVSAAWPNSVMDSSDQEGCEHTAEQREANKCRGTKSFGQCFFEDKATEIMYSHVEDTAGNRTSQTERQKTEQVPFVQSTMGTKTMIQKCQKSNK